MIRFSLSPALSSGRLAKFTMAVAAATETATAKKAGRLAVSATDYPGLDPDWVELWNEHGSDMVRADELTIEEYRQDPAKHSFSYPTWPGKPLSHPSRFVVY